MQGTLLFDHERCCFFVAEDIAECVEMDAKEDWYLTGAARNAHLLGLFARCQIS